MAAMAEIDASTEADMLADVRETVGYCPACICAAISQAQLPMVEWDTPGEYHFGNFHEGSHGEYRYRVKFNYKEERDDYRRENDADRVSDPPF